MMKLTPTLGSKEYVTRLDTVVREVLAAALRPLTLLEVTRILQDKIHGRTKNGGPTWQATRGSILRLVAADVLEEHASTDESSRTYYAVNFVVPVSIDGVEVARATSDANRDQAVQQVSVEDFESFSVPSIGHAETLVSEVVRDELDVIQLRLDVDQAEVDADQAEFDAEQAVCSQARRFAILANATPPFSPAWMVYARAAESLGAHLVLRVDP